MDSHSSGPKRSEMRVSLLILLLLAVIAVGVWRQQHRYNPAVLALNASAGTTARPPKGSTEKPPPSIVSIPADFIPMTPAESFGPETLSNKIDGKAEMYLSSGFVSLRSQRFASNSRSGSWMEMFVYDMGSPANAFSVFSAQRRDDAAPVDLTSHAYGTANALFLVHGSYYLEIVASDSSKILMQGVQATAERF